MRFLATKGDSPHRVIQHGRRGKAVPHDCIISVHHNINIHIHINIHIYIYIYIYIYILIYPDVYPYPHLEDGNT